MRNWMKGNYSEEVSQSCLVSCRLSTFKMLLYCAGKEKMSMKFHLSRPSCCYVNKWLLLNFTEQDPSLMAFES